MDDHAPVEAAQVFAAEEGAAAAAAGQREAIELQRQS